MALVSIVVTPFEVIVAIKRMRVGVAPSRNRSLIRFLRKCMLVIVPWLVVVFSTSLLNGHVPLKWCTARFSALRHSSKSDYTFPRS